MKNKYFLIGFIIILMAGVFATYSSGDPKNEIDGSYSKGDGIRGWINLSFEDESANSLFSDGQGNEIRLSNLLENSGATYSCDPNNCNSYYSPTSSGEIEKTIVFGPSIEEKLIGFNLDVDMDDITDFNLTIKSDVGASCENQLKIDFFNDGTAEVGNTKGLNNSFCTARNYGCFNFLEETILPFSISDNTFCQRISLPEAPGFRLGAWVEDSGSPSLTMSLYKEGDLKASCSLPDPTNPGSNIYCDVDYLVTKKDDYYVCLSSTQSSSNSMLRGYTKDKCGLNKHPSGNPEEVASYEIFAQPKTFAEIGKLNIGNEGLPGGASISILIRDYVLDKYDNLSCEGRDCIVPIRLISNTEQTLKINGEISYDRTFLGGQKDEFLSDVLEAPAKITADYQKISLDGTNFTVPNDIGPYDFSFFFKGTKLFEEEVEVKKGISILSISPTKTAAGLPTPFKVRIDSEKEISKYMWNFEGNLTQTTFTNEAKHTYDSVGNPTLTITVEDSEGTVSSKEFNIVVGSASEVLDEIILEKKQDLTRIQEQLLNYDLFSVNAIENVLDLESVKQNLTEIETEYLLIGTDELKAQDLLSRLLETYLPKSISQSSSSAPLTFYPKKENIDLDALIFNTGGDYGNFESEYKDSILGWNIDNIQIKVSLKEFSANYGFEEERLVSTFEIDIDDLGSQETPHLFIGQDLNFENNRSYEKGYYYEALSGNKIINVYTTQDISFEDLPVFISPSISELSIEGDTPAEIERTFKWGLFLIILLVVVLIGIGIYFFLKKWYKEKYENYLFKNKNDLYNMVTFIHSEKQKGKDNKTISKDLRKSGWSGEQISYVLKKYSGKEIGMPGFSKKPQKSPGPRPRRRF